MKAIKWMLLVPAVLVLTGCANVHVTYTLGEDMQSRAEYKIEFEADDVQSAGSASIIEEYWSGMGFDANTQTQDGKTVISGTRAQANDTRAEAADAFAAYLTSETSLFESASFQYLPDYEFDMYQLKAVVDLGDVIRQAQAQNIPEEELAALMTNAGSGEYLLSISLPGEIVEANADQVEAGLCTWTLKYGQRTQIELETKLVNEENVALYAGLEQEKKDADMWFKIGIIAASALLFILLVFLLIRQIVRARASRVSKVRVKKF